MSIHFILISMKTSKTFAKPGRPREFDPDEALDKALGVFRAKGYEGASLTDLTEAMGITRPSLYAAFGNKEELFRKVLDRYCDAAAPVLAELEGSPAREAVERFLMRSVQGQCGQKQAQGCLLVQGALSCSDESEHVRQELASRRGLAEKAMRDRLVRAREEGELSMETDPAELARYFATVSQGISVQVAWGTPPADLLQVIATAMRAWPAKD